MLEGLDEVDWASLSHAYGSAEDVPGCLRALVSEAEDDRKEAIHELFGNIYHQGTLYEATVQAVPFLIEIASDADYSELELVLILLGYLASGYDEGNWPVLEDEWASYAKASHDAVHSGIPFYLSYLSHPNPKVRIAASFVVSHFPDRKHSKAPAVYNQLQQETERTVRASLLRCWGLIYEESLEATNTLLGHASNPDEPLIFRCLAAIVLETRFPQAYREVTVPILWESNLNTGNLEDLYSEAVCGDKDAYNATLELLEPYALPHPEVIAVGFAQLLEHITIDGLDTGYRSIILSDLLSIAFPYLRGRSEEYPFLTKLQNSLLRQLVEKDGIWQYNIAQSLKERGLPTDRENLKQFLQDRANTLSPQ